MKFEMRQIEVYCSAEGFVCLSQDNYPDHEAVIVLAPEQIDTVIEWLQHAKVEALEQRETEDLGEEQV